MSKVCLCFSIAIFLALATDCLSAKPYRLKLLTFVAFTGNEPFDGTICRASMQIAVDAANSQQKVLRDYEINAVYINEGPLSLAIPQVVTEAALNMRKDEILSPVVLGSYFSPGCQRIGPALHHLGMVFIGIGCRAPDLIDKRKEYPNLYRLQIPGLNIVYLRVAMIKRFTNWRKIAVITYSENIFDWGNANLFYEISKDNGIDIVFYDAVPRVDDEVMGALKKSQARIIAIDLNAAAMTTQFLCLAYKHGIRGERYMIIGQTNGFVDPTVITSDNLPGGCTKEMLQEQYRITVWLGAFLNPDENYGKTDLGYDLDEFERRLDVATNKSRIIDYRSRHYCHDAMLQGLVTLDQAERRLKAQNLSLRDFATFPQQVMMETNRSAAQIDFMTLRVGQAHYSSRLEMDYEPMIMGQWMENPSRLQLTHKVILTPNTSYSDYKNYYFVERQKLTLALPRDWFIENEQTLDIAQEVRTVIYVIAGCVIFFHLAASCRLAFYYNKNKTLPVQSAIYKAFVLVGCFLLDAAAITFVINDAKLPFICIMKLTFLLSGFTLMVGPASALASEFSRWRPTSPGNETRESKLDNNAAGTSHAGDLEMTTNPGLSVLSNVPSTVGNNTRIKTSGSVVSRRSSMALTTRRETKQISALSAHEAKPKTLILQHVAMFILLNGLVLTAWVIANRDDHNLVRVQFEDMYTAASDTMTRRHGYLCRSLIYNAEWMYALIALHFAVMIISLLRAYRTHRRLKLARLKDDEVFRLMLLQINVIIILIAIIFILAVLRRPFDQLVVVSFGALFISTATSVIALFDIFRKSAPGSRLSAIGGF